jgi:putative ATP-dependent endonuclease of the OLD family
MRVARLRVTNFRGVADATLHFQGHTLLVGTNNVGKSTVCEALDLVLGPDRLAKSPPVQEFDFYNARYLEDDKETPRPLRVEVALTGLTDEVTNACGTHLEFWHSAEQRLLAEGEADLVGQAVIVAEGLTEQIALWAVSEKMEAADEANYPLDLSGVTVFSSDGDGALPAFGEFFKNLGLSAYAFYDKKARSADEIANLETAFDLAYETDYMGAEALLVEEVPVARQWQLLDEIRESDQQGNVGIPVQRPDDDGVKSLCLQLLKGRKGDGTAGRLIEMCDHSELPASIETFLRKVYAAFRRPEPVAIPAALDGDSGSTPETDGITETEAGPQA